MILRTLSTVGYTTITAKRWVALVSIVPMGGLFNWHSNAQSLSTSPEFDAGLVQTASSASYTPAKDQDNALAFTSPVTEAASSVKSSPKKRSATEASDPTSASPSSASRSENPENANKRKRNTEAARRYRQRKFDRVTELEEALEAMTKDRDELRMKLARSETEADVLRGIVGKRA